MSKIEDGAPSAPSIIALKNFLLRHLIFQATSSLIIQVSKKDPVKHDRKVKMNAVYLAPARRRKIDIPYISYLSVCTMGLEMLVFRKNFPYLLNK